MKFDIKPENRRKQFNLLIKKATREIEAAKLLCEKGFHNDSISRAYYAIFDAACAALITKGFAAKTHAGVIYLFETHFVKTDEIPAKYIRFFREAKRAREEADYHAIKIFSKRDAQEAVQKAEEFVSYIKKIVKKQIQR